jgi:signal transduction histidine kinase/CheY-like chemotaxis protein
MTLGRHILVSLLAVFVALTLLLGVTQTRITTHALRRIEQRAAMLDAGRVQSALEQYAHELTSKVWDWSNWDDMVHFARTREPKFITSNITNSTYQQLHIDVIVVVDTNNRRVFARCVDHVTGLEAPMPARLPALLGEPASDLSRLAAGGGGSGLLMLDDGPVMVACRPILTSTGRGPPAGRLLFAYRLGQREVGDLAGRLHMKLLFARADHGSPPILRPQDAPALAAGNGLAAAPLDGENLVAYVLARDVAGRPGVLFRADLPRDYWQQGLASLRLQLVALVLSLFVLAAVTLALLHVFVLRRVHRLHAEVVAIAGAAQSPARVSESGADEITGLARAVNTMLASLDAANAALRRSRDQAEAANRAKSEFLATMSHEIRTPMNGVMGMTSLLLDTPLAPLQREYAETISGSADALLSIINDILELSKIESGRLTLESAPFDLASACEDVCELMAGRASQKGLRLELDYPPEAPSRLIGDAGRLRQVLLNLVGNAVKFTSEGGVRVWVRCVRFGEGNATIRVHVSDTGIGIAAGKIESLFQAFVQADSSMARRFGGTGLGLAISRRLVELMKGDMGVESEEGRGSTFWFTATLPMHTRQSIRARGPAPLSGAPVLVADADGLAAGGLRSWLEAWGARVQVVASAGAALAAVRDAKRAGEPVRLLLLDQALGEGDLPGVVRELRGAGMDADGRVLVAGSRGRVADQERLALAGTNGWLAQPWRAATLSNVCGRLLAPGEAPAFVTRETAAESREPAAPGAAFPTVDDALLMLSGPPPLHGMRVLLVEDNATNQRVAQRMLERAGCVVTLASNGIEAVERFRAETFDVVFMDCQMPVMDGYEATRAIRALEAEPARTPIIALTANAMEGDRERCLACGMDDFVSKPVRRELMLAAIERWGAGGSAREQAA